MTIEEQQLLELETPIEGIIYPYRPGDYETLIKRAFNILEVLQNIQFSKPGLAHYTNGKRGRVSSQLQLLLREGDSIKRRSVLLDQVFEAEMWAQALFYNPIDFNIKGDQK